MKFSQKKAWLNVFIGAAPAMILAGLTWAVARMWLRPEDAAFGAAIIAALTAGHITNGVAFKWAKDNQEVPDNA